MARVLAEIETRSGSTIRKIETSQGDVRYQSFNNQRKGEGQFIPNSQGERLFEQAGRNDTVDQSNVNFTVEPQTEEDRLDALKARYPQWNNTEGYSEDVYSSNMDGRERQIVSYMSHKSIEQRAKNDPFARTKTDRRRIKESIAREVMNKIENADSQKEVDEILAQYFDS